MSNTSLLGSFGGQAGDALMFRNRIINGDMKVSQRYDNVAAHPITAGQIFYTIDRFFVFATGANVTGQRIAGTGANPYVYRITGAASNTQCLLIQRIEALNSEDLVNKTVTLQFEASAAVITSLDYDIRVPSARDNFGTTASVTSGTVTVSATPTVFTVTCTLPANAANGLQINLGKTSGLVASQTFSISGVQLEAGPTATPFERRPIGVEQSLCERYFERGGYSWIGNFTAAALVRVTILFRQLKRAQPVCTATKGYSDGTLAGVNPSTAFPDVYGVRAQFSATGASNQSEMAFDWTASAEL